MATPLQSGPAGPRVGADPRVAAAAACFALAACLSYAGQRLFSFALGEAPPEVVIAQAHVPYYWRVGLSLFHGGAAALLVGFGAGRSRATSLLPWMSRLILPAVLLCAAAMVLVP